MDDKVIAPIISTFPAVFGLRAYPGSSFRISLQSSYVNDSGVPQLYTQRLTGRGWLDAIKATESELRAELVTLHAQEVA